MCGCILSQAAVRALALGRLVARILSCARQANQIPAEPASGGTILQPLRAKIFRLAQDFYLASSAGDNASAKIIIIPNPITEIASHFLFCAPTFTIQVLLEKRCKTTAANISNPTYRCRISQSCLERFRTVWGPQSFYKRELHHKSRSSKETETE